MSKYLVRPVKVGWPYKHSQCRHAEQCSYYKVVLVNEVQERKQVLTSWELLDLHGVHNLISLHTTEGKVAYASC